MYTHTMEPTKIPRVKICCIKTVEEAQLAIKYGASAVGLVSSMPSGPGCIPESLIADIARVIPPAVSSFLLTSHQDAASIIAQQKRTHVNTIQIVDQVHNSTYTRLRDALPSISLVQVIHVAGEESIKKAQSKIPYVDALLLDSGDPYLPVKELGGTGRTHDWRISNHIRKISPVPVFLAGGLNPGNVRKALQQVNPFGVDVCSGVRTHSILDEAKLSQFFQRIRQFSAANINKR